MFEPRGCAVVVREMGHSYRSGGEIFIVAPGLAAPDNGAAMFAAPVKFARADFTGFSGTGYDGRGRSYAVWIVTAGEMVECSEAEFANAPESERAEFGAEHRSCANRVLFCTRSAKATRGMSDLAGAFAALGL